MEYEKRKRRKVVVVSTNNYMKKIAARDEVCSRLSRVSNNRLYRRETTTILLVMLYTSCGKCTCNHGPSGWFTGPKGGCPHSPSPAHRTQELSWGRNRTNLTFCQRTKSLESRGGFKIYFRRYTLGMIQKMYKVWSVTHPEFVWEGCGNT